MPTTPVRFLAITLLAVLAATQVHAAPWAEAGDAALRSDLETLANAGVINDLTMQWPLPWDRILRRLSDDSVLDG